MSGAQGGHDIARRNADARIGRAFVAAFGDLVAQPVFDGGIPARSARRPSRITSLSVAYSPEATFASTVSAISWGESDADRLRPAHGRISLFLKVRQSVGSDPALSVPSRALSDAMFG